MPKQPKSSPEADEARKAANEALGRRLQLVRLSLKKTQQEVAEAMGLKQSRVSRWESGEDGMYAFQLGYIAKALGVSADTILDVENTTRPSKGELLYLEVAKEIGFDQAWRILIKYGEPAKMLDSDDEAGGHD